MMYYDQFNTGKRIQKLRRERYLTQEELAVRLNVSDRHLRSLESGEYIPSIDLFIEIAAFFAAKAFDKSKAPFEIAAYYAETVCNR